MFQRTRRLIIHPTAGACDRHLAGAITTKQKEGYFLHRPVIAAEISDH